MPLEILKEIKKRELVLESMLKEEANTPIKSKAPINEYMNYIQSYLDVLRNNQVEEHKKVNKKQKNVDLN